MKKNILFLLFVFSAFIGFSQPYEFQTIKDIDALPVISQGRTGTCWSFSSTSFLEAEILRITGRKMDLSEMYNVKYTYLDKAENYVMRQGKAQFGEGGLNHDVINSAKKYGIVYEDMYTGKVNPNERFDHSKMVKELEDILKKAVADTPAKYPNWKQDYLATLDKYMGQLSIEEKSLSQNNTLDRVSNKENKSLSPKQILELSKLNLNDYITVTSFTQAPFYSQFILNIPDNFSNGFFYNLPLNEFIQTIDYALDNDFTLALDADVSEPTFSSTAGMAVIPMNDTDAKEILTSIKPEKQITQEYRQQEFENFNTTDDHLMHIVGKVKDQKGNIYYKVKNSWGTDSGKNGYIYMSVAYMRLKAISVMLHKDALAKTTKKELGI
ncbi:C1 family peptidase [Flavobacterium capsici]|uniref:Aminopeptidase n=1 Tax=Flavobacterium capsici TaxID=3075618 RepID=A0AA96J8N6_9FLAO|nr:MULTISPECIES: C1 family peptidase [unclassified Flavobacterium]WNM18555.1 C1 family peptidase [Flavobacterium sp. PMR2A8]WNM22606.1 C1 family peptidase [Flavobacterium sp. PMTSA4]